MLRKEIGNLIFHIELSFETNRLPKIKLANYIIVRFTSWKG